MKGRLFIVSTPIGNLEDITLRAKRVLGEVDLVAAEDTRRTGRLLAHLGLRKPMVSYHDFNKEKRTPELISRLLRGEDVALVSDAGTPGISDPAYYLVVRAVEEGIEVVPVPGPTAFVAALVVSGLPTDRFTFEGFLPHRASRRRKRLEELKGETRTMIFYESPHRISETLKDILEVLGDRRASLSRELTKRHEETRRGRIGELLESCRLRPPKGELVLVVEGAGKGD